MTAGKSHARRTFLTVGAGSIVAGVAASRTAAQAPAAGARPAAPSEPDGGAGVWHAARHAEDDWLDRIPGVHRLVIDTTTPEGFDEALLYADNFFSANRNAYALADADLAVVIVVRHDSTAFGYTDAIWEKYGASLVRAAGFADPATKQPPRANIHRARIERLVKRGAHLAVCQMATRFLAGRAAAAAGGTAEAVYQEIAGHLFDNAHLVPAGIVALSRAQERGYSLAHGV